MSKLETARRDWYPVAMADELQPGDSRRSRLLEEDILLRAEQDGTITVHSGETQWLTQIAYGHIWTSPSQSPRTLFAIPEAAENGRRL
ncbi:MAG: hypothetical protein ACPG51_12520, partial [Thiolinea sp.]